MRTFVLVGFWGALLFSVLGFFLLYGNLKNLQDENNRMVEIENMIKRQQDLSSIVVLVSEKKNLRIEREWKQAVDSLTEGLKNIDSYNNEFSFRKSSIEKILTVADSTMNSLQSLQSMTIVESGDSAMLGQKYRDLQVHLSIQVHELGRQLHFVDSASKSQINELYQKVSLLLMGFISGLLVYASIALVLMKKYFLTPIKVLLAGIREFAGGNLAYRIPVIPSPELYQIATTANDMAEHIEGSMVKREALELSEYRFRQYFECSATAQLLCTPQGEIIGANRQFGVLIEGAVEDGLLLSALFKEEEYALVHAEIHTLRMSKQGSFRDIKVALLSRAGELKPCLLSGVLLSSNEIMLSLENITELIRYQTQLERSNRELEQFAYVASHDLREPLRMVASFTQLLQTRYGEVLGEEGNEFIDFAVDGAKRMNTLVDDLLRLSRINTQEKDFEAVSLRAVMETVTGDLQILLHERSAEVTIEITEDIFLCGDFMQVKQVFQNLLSNAVKFTAKECIPKISIRALQGENSVVISVVDNGIGIKKEHFERIFQVFKRLCSREEYEGNGIGLSICKKIIEKHNGTIDVTSEYGKGTTFTVTLPRYKEKVCTVN